jgi:hypothetical protein
MSAEDFEVFRLIKEERQEKRRSRREAFNGGEGWTRHHETHWSYVLHGERLDYWPGPQRFRWKGKTMNGDVLQFIAKRLVP